MKRFITNEIELSASANGATVLRKGWRARLAESVGKEYLAHLIAGQIPYYYRKPENIAADFSRRHNALDMIMDLANKAPKTAKFRQSHCGEIFCSLYVEQVLGFKRLYSKLTLTTSEDTNVHKMDAFFVEVSKRPFTYLEVEAKSSILPTTKTKFSGHRHGILKQLITSLESYDPDDERFDFTAIRDNLERENFSESERSQIYQDLTPPGPQNLLRMGMAAINHSTVCQEDDDFILTTPCQKIFDYRALVVTDLAKLATEAYEKWSELVK